MSPLQFIAIFFLLAASPSGDYRFVWYLGLVAGIAEILITHVDGMRRRFIEIKRKNEGAWPWCDQCRSWHHPDMPHIRRDP